jgi:hypothetical protein
MLSPLLVLLPTSDSFALSASASRLGEELNARGWVDPKNYTCNQAISSTYAKQRTTIGN